MKEITMVYTRERILGLNCTRNLGSKMVHPHNSGLTLRIFFKSFLKGANR